jgi:radical SAM superfamily enzyme YgiQ (UPF0313 family)
LQVYLVNPSDVSFGVGVITPRWLYVLAGATPRRFGDPIVVDETIETFQAERIHPGDIVGIGIHTSNAHRGYELGRMVRRRGGFPVFGGIHASLFPEESQEHGHAESVVRGDGDLIWATVLSDSAERHMKPIYDGGMVSGADFATARWDLMPRRSYMWASVQTVRGCPKHCSFCSVWRTDGQMPRLRPVKAVIDEVITLRRMGFRFIALADDNFYPVTLHDLNQASQQQDKSRYERLSSLMAERFSLMEQLSRIPASDLIIFTQITMEAAENPDFLIAMKSARIKGALVGIESVMEDGLKKIYKGFNASGENLVARIQAFGQFGIHVLGSFIFGLPTDTPETFSATGDIADRSGMTFAQFVPLTPFPGTIDFENWEKQLTESRQPNDKTPVTRHWLIPTEQRPKVYIPHPSMSPDEIRRRTQQVWDFFYSLPKIWRRSRCVPNLRSRLAFLLISKLYYHMYARTGIATDSARQSVAVKWARLIARPCQRLFAARAMPELQLSPSAQYGDGLVNAAQATGLGLSLSGHPTPIVESTPVALE